jgi:hypothetical protein
MEYVTFVFNAFVYGLAVAAFVTPAIIIIVLVNRQTRK